MTKRIVSILTVLLLVTALALPVNALPTVSGEVDGYTEEIYDGVYHSYFAMEGEPYGKQKVHVVEFDLAQRDLDIEILKGQYLVSKATVPNYAKAYNTEHADEGKEVLAAMNGDLWMTGVHSGPKVSKQVLMVPRGVLISDGKLYCSSQIKEESKGATNGEGHATFWAFGVTEDHVPVIGQPIVQFSINNTTMNKTVKTKAFNRLPAIDALVIYNGDCNFSNYALDDAYEVVLKDIGGEFRFGTTVTGTVAEILGPDDGTSPDLTSDSIVLTARGTAIDKIKDFSVGDKISIDMTVTDKSGRDNDWTKVTTAIGGHIPMVMDGKSTGVSSKDKYPASIVGFKNDGKIVFIQNDGRNPRWSEGIPMGQVDELMAELGVNTAINLDGGGSSCMVVGEEVVNHPSDGTPRTVINGIALVSCPEREPQAEFTPKTPYGFDARYLKFDSADAVEQLTDTSVNQTTAELQEGYVRLTPDAGANDPFLYYGLSGAYETLSADDYKYVVLKYRTSEKVTTSSMEIFLCAGSIAGPTGGYSTMAPLQTDGEWHTAVVDLTSFSYWTGAINGIRLDYFAGNSDNDEYFDLEYVAFAKDEAEANGYADGTAEIPAGKENTSITLTEDSAYKLENGVISGVNGGTTAYDFFGGISGKKLELVDANGLPSRSGPVGTGFKVRTYNTKLEVGDEATVIVTGDVNGDGYSDNMDAVMILKHEAGTETLEGLFLTAADMDGDGAVNNIDAVAALKYDAGL